MPSALGDFLVARRAALRPEDLGLRSAGPRRVAGLRREEVAVRAAVSSDYYTRLEQGRELHPSAGVLDGLAEALALDADGRAHLYGLAGLAAPVLAAPRGTTVAPELLMLLDAWPATPALILDDVLGVLAANALGDALFAGFAAPRNLVRMLFLDPAAADFYVEWDVAARSTVASLRAAAAPGDPRLRELVDEVAAGSPAFASLWAAHDVGVKRRDAKLLHHPQVGRLRLAFETFDVRSAPGRQLVVYQAEPGSRSAEALDRLSGLVDDGAVVGTDRDRPPG
ncbi:helix-turn-helix transcriptional regulator [Patulibacter minatonensis]|uniref:helix-turn-helix transcriptional regulator n=1 Tax=Patulibacter minatonensis TaxID=298163 RepID=UPI000564E38F|nr:helix-turn-helix transcriptional regulator [Patulibacter minatonensis]